MKEDLISEMKSALLCHDLDRAEAYWFQLRERDDVRPEVLAAGVAIYIYRGDYLAAMHFIDTLPEGTCPAMRVIVLQLLGDPLWESEARILMNHSSDAIKGAMQRLLGTHHR